MSGTLRENHLHVQYMMILIFFTANLETNSDHSRCYRLDNVGGIAFKTHRYDRHVSIQN